MRSIGSSTTRAAISGSAPREGLSRFDGHGFTTYTVDEGLPSAVINDLVETREGIYSIARTG